MPPSSNGPNADRNLLFGILALQVNFIDRDALVAAMHAWVLDKDKPLGQILLEHGNLTVEQLQALDLLIVQHLKAHGGDSERSLQALSSSSSARSVLSSISDPDVQSRVTKLDSESNADKTQEFRPQPSDGARYLRLRHHADGGLGKLYVAEDTELHREVALKEIKPELADNPDSRSRFILEAEITGGLEHPGIVPVYGLGVYPSGRPYYAMRFIRGDSLKFAIHAFHAAEAPERDRGERSLAFRQLLGRFVDTCNAVAYAHSRGVLHRDLKPANVMLGKFGETLVVDWGLAKAGIKAGGAIDKAGAAEERTLRPSSGSSVETTQAGSTLGTPAYMSPEQASGRLDDLGPASDIYSLGSTLYVLLTGQKAFPATDKAEVMAQVRSGQFTLPKQLKPQMPAALDAICRKAMALQPKDRYPTALALAADVEHWLGDEPVEAYAEPWTVRTGRWARRHKTGLVGAAVFLVSAVIALAASTGLIWAEQQKTGAQHRRAEGNYILARDLSFNSIDLLENIDFDLSAQGFQGKRKEMLTKASEHCRQLLEQQPDDPELWKRAARVFHYTANDYRLENQTAEADALYRDSIGLLEKLAVQFPSDVAGKIRLVDTRRDHANLQAKTGKLREAGDSLAKGLKTAREVLEEGKDQPNHQRMLAQLLLDLAMADYLRGKVKESLDAADQSAQLFTALAKAPEKGHPYDPLLLAMALNQLAVAQRESGDLGKARTNHSSATKMLEAMRKTPPARVVLTDLEHMSAWCALDQARTLAKFPDAKLKAGAETNLRIAAARWEELVKKNPNIPRYRWFLAAAHLVRGQLRSDDKKSYDEARQDFDNAEKLLAKLVEEYPDSPSYRADLGRAYAGLARLAADEKERARLFRLAMEALDTAVTQSPDNAQDRQFFTDVKKAAK